MKQNSEFRIQNETSLVVIVFVGVIKKKLALVA